MSQGGSENRALTRWKGREFVVEFLEQLREAMEEAARERSSLDTLEQDWRRDAQAAGFSAKDIDQSLVWFRLHAVENREGEAPAIPPESVRRVLVYNALHIIEFARKLAPALLKSIGLVYEPPVPAEEAWRRAAQAVGLSAQEIGESWVWFRRHAFEAPPVLEETEQRTARQTMPKGVQRVLKFDPAFWFIGYDHDLFADLGLSIDDEEQLVAAADDWRFWADISHAWTDPPDADARLALDRLAKLVRLKPEHTRDLATKNETTMEATKRRLVQEAVLLSLGAADERIRIGRRTVKGDAGHPITLKDIFGAELDAILISLRTTLSQPLSVVGDDLERSLGGPAFRPARLADRKVYRGWLTKEIQRRTVELLGQDLDVRDASRAGGSRRREISYDENEPLPGVARGQLGSRTQAFTDNEMRAAGERDDQERGGFRSAAQYTEDLEAWEKKDRIERSLADRIDWQELLERIQRQREAPVLQEYITCVIHAPLLMDDDVAAGLHLGWQPAKVRDVKRRLNYHITLILAEQRWKSLRP